MADFLFRFFGICFVCGVLVAVSATPDGPPRNEEKWIDVPQKLKNEKPERPGVSRPCPSKKLVRCPLNPCDTEYCPKHPLAFCRMNNCGYCKAEFYFVDNGKVLDDCGKICNEACPRNYDPVCASDKKTYGNLCMFNAARCLSKGLIKFQHIGECDES